MRMKHLLAGLMGFSICAGAFAGWDGLVPPDGLPREGNTKPSTVTPSLPKGFTQCQVSQDSSQLPNTWPENPTHPCDNAPACMKVYFNYFSTANESCSDTPIVAYSGATGLVLIAQCVRANQSVNKNSKLSCDKVKTMAVPPGSSVPKSVTTSTGAIQNCNGNLTAATAC